MNHFSLKRFLSLSFQALIISACSHTDNIAQPIEDQSLNSQVSHYLQDVQFIAKLPRTPGSNHHQEIQKMCAKRFSALGFEMETHNYGSGTNIIGIYPGKLNINEKILVSAHYDTVANCKGADDNASGLAGVFETARLLAAKKHDRTLIVACWDEEESGMAGVKAFVEREKNRSSDIKISYIYEMIAYTSKQSHSQQIPSGFEYLYPEQIKRIQNNQSKGDFIALVYDDRASKMLTTVNNHANRQSLSLLQFEVSTALKKSPLATDLRRSDHSAFWDADYPAVMITDTANFRNPHYHCLHGNDEVKTLDPEFAIKVLNTLSKTIEQNLNSDRK